ncbi:dynamin family protein [Thermodesulfobacteriota bacterium]
MKRSVDEKISDILAVANLYIQNIDEGEREKELRELEPLIERLSLRIFRIVVVGEVKKGKSSFINALLSEKDLLPTATDVVTSTVFKIIYGPEYSYHVYKRPETSDEGQIIESEPIKINKNDLWTYGSQSAEKSDQNQVDFIGIEAPNPLLRQGLILVDTPGLGSLFRGHGEITLRYVPNADAVFFILDSVESVISQDEIEFLKHLYQFTKKIIFIQTKIDAVSPDQWKSWRERNLDIISEKIHIPRDKIVYICVSSKIKAFADEHDASQSSSEWEERMDDLKDSGFTAVNDLLNNYLMAKKDRILAHRVARILSQKISSYGQLLKDRLQIANETNTSTLEETEAMIKKVREDLIYWQRGGFQKELRTFNERVSDLHENARNRIEDEFFPAGQILRGVLEDIKSSLRSESEVVKNAEKIVSNYDDQAIFFGYQVLKEFQEQILQAHNEFVKQQAGIVDEILTIKKIGVNSKAILPQLRTKEIIDFEAIRNFAINAAVGNGIALLAAKVAVFVVNPFAGIAVLGGGFLFALWAGRKGFIDVRKKKREWALNEIEKAIIAAAGNFRKDIMRDLDRIAKDFRNECHNLFENMLQSIVKELETRLLDVQKARSRTKQESQEEIKVLKIQLESSVELDKRIREVSYSLAKI